LTILNLDLQGDTEELQNFFIELLGEIGFFTIHNENWKDGFMVIGASAKRSSQLLVTIMNIFIGYIQRNRIAIELVANKENVHLDATLKCVPYLDVVDFEAPNEKPEEREKCKKLANFFNERIQEKFSLVSKDN
jgi:hypothetical protein